MTAESQDVSGAEEELGAVIFACLQDVEAGRRPDRERLIAEYPRFAAELKTFFLNQDKVERMAAPLREVVSSAETGPSDLEKTLFSSPIGGAETIRTLGDYELLHEIGRGGMGVVYQARQRGLNRLVALKRIVAGQLASPRERLRFRTEAETAASLDHPHIVPIYEVGEVEDHLFFSMKFIEGGSLNHQLARFGTDPRAAARLLAIIARAVHFAHQRGILHRDLKPANILLMFSRDAESSQRSAGTAALRREDSASRLNEVTPYITDFGLAKRLPIPGQAGVEELARSGDIVGSPLYMAPEQAVPARGPVTTATDVYGLGGILYALLAGHSPFQGATVLDTLQQVIGRDPQPLRRDFPRIDRDLETICLKCLEKEPARRYPSAEALAQDLERWLAYEPIQARRVGRVERLWCWGRRKPAAAALVSFVLAAGVAVAVGLLVLIIRLQRAVDRADANLAEAHLQHEQSDTRYRVARDSMHRMVERLNAPRLADVPRLRELRQELLEDALAFYQAVLQQADDPDPVVRRDAAYAFTETGAIQSLLGQAGRSDEQFRRAIALIEGLPAEYRDHPKCRNKLAVCHSHLGAHAGGASRYAEAERHFRAERALCEQLAHDEPGNADWQDELARAEHHLGRLCLSTSRLPEARTHYLRAVEIRTRLVGEHPTNESYQSHLAETCINLGVVHIGLGHRPQARAAGEKAIGVLRTLVERHPKNLDWKMSLAGAYMNAGNLLKDEGKPREALKLLDRAVELADDTLQQEPRHNVAQERAYNAHGARAQVCENLGDWAAAVKDFDRVVALDRFPEPWRRRLLRAIARVKAGEHVRATEEARALEKQADVTAEGQYYLACVYALAVERAQTDSKRPEAERSALADRHASQGMALLQKLQGQGYFHVADNAKALAEDEDLRGLRTRSDFQRLLQQVEGRKK